MQNAIVTPEIPALHAALKHLNRKYGRGDIIETRLHFSGKHTATRYVRSRSTGDFYEDCRFSLRAARPGLTTVRMHGHQITIINTSCSSDIAALTDYV